MKTLIFAVLLGLGFTATANAGQWSCETGLDGKLIYKAVVSGDDSGHLDRSANVSVAGMPSGPMPVVQLAPGAGELTRVSIGANDPRSNTVLRILADEVTPGVHKAYSLLVNMPLKQELEGTCQFTP